MNDKETLEEAAYRLYPIILEDEWDKNKQYRDEWIEGAKWQQERMYSEEGVGEIVYNIVGELAKYHSIIIDGVKLNELFEQFKKK